MKCLLLFLALAFSRDGLYFLCIFCRQLFRILLLSRLHIEHLMQTGDFIPLAGEFGFESGGGEKRKNTHRSKSFGRHGL